MSLDLESIKARLADRYLNWGHALAAEKARIDVQALIEEIERLREELAFFAAAELDEAALRAMDQEPG